MNLKRNTTAAVAILMSIIGFSQNEIPKEATFKYEIELGTDNDNFIVYTGTDRNYTYGINGSFKWIPKDVLFDGVFQNSENHYQKIGLHIEGYTPNYLNEDKPNRPNIERPFAGWSYLNFETAYTFKKSFFNLSLDLGILGPSSQVDDIQNWVHERITNDATVDWSAQIPNQLGINLRGNYTHELYSMGWLDTYATSELAIGNIFTYLKPQLNLRIGQFNSITESVAVNNRIFASKKKSEFFLEYGLAYKFSAYNATVQGGVFGDGRNRNNAINHTVFSMHLGLNLAFNNWGMAFNYHYGTGEFEKTQVHRYGAIRVFYRFR